MPRRSSTTWSSNSSSRRASACGGTRSKFSGWGGGVDTTFPVAAWATSAIAADGAFEERLTIDGPIVLDVSTGSGRIEISPGPGNEVFVRGEINVNNGGLFRGRRGDKDEIVQAEQPATEEEA